MGPGRSGTAWLLDARDISGVVERGAPVSAAELVTRLRKDNACLALSQTNVTEAARPWLEAGASAKVRELFQSLERLPVCYLREIVVYYEELAGALAAFGRGREPQPVDPYCDNWNQTLGISLAKTFAGFRISDTLLKLWQTRPQILRHSNQYQEILAEDIPTDAMPAEDMPAGQPGAEAGIPAGEVFSRYVARHFALYVARQMKLHGLVMPPARMADFAAWVYSSPRRCPGLRLGYETHREILRSNDMAALSGIQGLGHVHAIPYADAATLAPPLFQHCQAATQRLAEQDSAADYSCRLFPDLESLLG